MRIRLLIGIFFILTFFIVKPAYAMILRPGSSDVQANSTFTITVKADSLIDPIHVNAVRLHLSISGGTVNSFTINDNLFVMFSGCNKLKSMFSSSEICVDAGSDGSVAESTIGTFSITSGASGIMVITKMDDNAYYAGADLSKADTGVIATYNILTPSAITTTPVPINPPVRTPAPKHPVTPAVTTEPTVSGTPVITLTPTVTLTVSVTPSISVTPTHIIMPTNKATAGATDNVLVSDATKGFAIGLIIFGVFLLLIGFIFYVYTVTRNKN